MDETSDASFSSSDTRQRRNINGFKIMSITRDYSDEADKILNYLEHGIFHALQMQYLRSFIFAIYLDSKDPNNIVEAYTFNFQYHKVPGTDTVVPIMSLGDGLRKMNLKGKNRLEDDPVAAAAKKGKAPTLRDVKKSVKTLLKTLIHATTQMDVLPKRRFATFKVFYTEDTPSDYEPPHFQAGDAEKDKWFFMTHDLDEVPDKWSIGKVETGHHSVNLNITSIATYLPSSTEHDNAPFAGTTHHRPNQLTLTPIQEATVRAQQIERQNKDADERNIVWSVEDIVELHDIDGECEDDPDYVKLPDGSYEKIIFHSSGSDFVTPIGLRNEVGEIEPLPQTMNSEEVCFSGISEPVPTRLDQLNSDIVSKFSNIEQTQVLESLTQDLSMPSRSGQHLLPSSIVQHDTSPSQTRYKRGIVGFDSSMSSFSSTLSSPGSKVNNQALTTFTSNQYTTVNDVEMLDIETQPQAAVSVPDTIESIKSYELYSAQNFIETDVPTPKASQGTHKIDIGLNCECGVSIKDESCYCEGGCERWYHIWCMGYHSIKDPRMPASFTCFDCRVRADTSWELIKINLYPKMLSNFQDLALFRRAIKVAEKEKPETPTAFAKMTGGNNTLARQLFKRLETEGFIEEQSTTLDDLGFTETHSRSLKAGKKTKSKAPKNRKNVQKTKYKFNRSKLSTTEYADYFNTDAEVEGRLLGLKELYARFGKGVGSQSIQPAPGKPLSHQTPTQTQTQNETQIDFSPSKHDHTQKRVKSKPSTDENIRPTKKIKISVTCGVDLAE
ncbi:HORMA domain-containing protein [Collybia nuda]|uniref:HORMA domain-containing protein n=1 Tax=Collybia nuda TaxID=64659 RepID=A0A9P5YII6_9AGAR|nr:HORMA domain-containing protein [Collybia nuda]